MFFFFIHSPAVGSILFPETHKVSDEAFLKIKPLGRSQDGKSYVIILEEVWNTLIQHTRQNYVTKCL